MTKRAPDAENDFPRARLCKGCNEWKSQDQFHTYNSTENGPSVMSQCQPCVNRRNREHRKRRLETNPEREKSRQREAQQKSKYGITAADYLQMLNSQGGGCAICGSKTSGRKHKTKEGEQDVLLVDHDHKTGKVRGLLCVNCNSGLGHFKDDANRLRLAIQYIEKGETK